jgi:hypothetical protein
MTSYLTCHSRDTDPALRANSVRNSNDTTSEAAALSPKLPHFQIQTALEGQRASKGTEEAERCDWPQATIEGTIGKKNRSNFQQGRGLGEKSTTRAELGSAPNTVLLPYAHNRSKSVFLVAQESSEEGTGNLITNEPKLQASWRERDWQQALLVVNPKSAAG